MFNLKVQTWARLMKATSKEYTKHIHSQSHIIFFVCVEEHQREALNT